MTDDELEKLIDRAVSGTLTDTEFKMLDAAIAENDAAARNYLEAMQLHTDLQVTSRTNDRTSSFIRQVKENQQAQPPKPKSFPTAWLVAAAAALAIVGVVLYNGSQENEPARNGPVARVVRVANGPIVATVSQVNQAVFTEGIDGVFHESDSVRVGDYELQSGIIQLKMADETTALLQGPASFTVAADNRIQLLAGSIVVHMGKKAQSFFVDAPGVEVQDLGTVFGVEVTSPEYTDIHVYEGSVLVRAVKASVNPQRPTRLNAGSALRIFRTTGLESGIDLSEDRFITKLNPTHNAASPEILALRPVVYFPIEATADGASRLIDVSERKLNADVVGLDSGVVSWAPGVNGNALQLPGPTERMAYAVVPDYPKSKTNTVSGMAWVYAESRPLWSSILKNWGESSGQFHFGLYKETGDLEVHVMTADEEEVFVREGTPLPLHQWHHVAFVADGNQLSLYRNGKLIGSQPYERLYTQADIRVLTIGAKLNDTGVQPDLEAPSNWHGRLDHVALFNHALTVEQIRNIYEKTKPELGSKPSVAPENF